MSGKRWRKKIERRAFIERQSAQLKKCGEQIAALQAELKAERIENELLRQKVHLLARRLYGPSSEKMSAELPDFWELMEMADEDMPSGKAGAFSWTNEEPAPPARCRTAGANYRRKVLRSSCATSKGGGMADSFAQLHNR